MYFLPQAVQINLDDVMNLADMGYDYLYYLQSHDTYFRMFLDNAVDWSDARNSNIM